MARPGANSLAAIGRAVAAITAGLLQFVHWLMVGSLPKVH